MRCNLAKHSVELDVTLKVDAISGRGKRPEWLLLAETLTYDCHGLFYFTFQNESI